MPTPAQVTNRAQPVRPLRTFTATVVTVGPPVTVELDPGSNRTTAINTTGAALVVGGRVLVLVSGTGNWIIGRL